MTVSQLVLDSFCQLPLTVSNIDVTREHTFGLIFEFNTNGANKRNACIKGFYYGKKLPPVGLITESRIL